MFKQQRKSYIRYVKIKVVVIYSHSRWATNHNIYIDSSYYLRVASLPKCSHRILLPSLILLFFPGFLLFIGSCDCYHLFIQFVYNSKYIKIIGVRVSYSQLDRNWIWITKLQLICIAICKRQDIVRTICLAVIRACSTITSPRNGKVFQELIHMQYLKYFRTLFVTSSSRLRRKNDFAEAPRNLVSHRPEDNYVGSAK